MKKIYTSALLIACLCISMASIARNGELIIVQEGPPGSDPTQ